MKPWHVHIHRQYQGCSGKSCSGQSLCPQLLSRWMEASALDTLADSQLHLASTLIPVSLSLPRPQAEHRSLPRVLSATGKYSVTHNLNLDLNTSFD